MSDDVFVFSVIVMALGLVCYGVGIGVGWSIDLIARQVLRLV